jgi:protein tyrosine/serine phosphatase
MTTGRALLLIFALLLPPGIVAVAERSQRYPRRFAEVVPGKVFRGGFPTARHVRNLAEDKGLKTILSLTGSKPEPKYVEETETAKAVGVRLVRIAMPGDGCGDFEDLDRAADAIGNRANWPLFFHCDAGKQRSNAALAAYRLRKCGWTIEQVLAELQTGHGLDQRAEKNLVDHLRRYAALAVRPSQPSKPGRGG